MEANFDPHDGIIDGENQVPDLGRYVDFGGFWSDDFILTIDHLVYEDWGEERPDVRVRINGKELDEFCWHIEVGSNNDRPTGITPKDDVFRESRDVRLEQRS